MEKVYLDTNAFYFFFFEQKEYSEGIKKTFAGIQKGRYKGITSVVTLEELAYVTLMRLMEKKYRKHPSEVLKENRGAIAEISEDVKAMFEVILSLKNIEIAGLNRDAASIIPMIMADHLLLPQDSIHLQTMKEYGCELILSTDKDFDGVYGIKRIKPEEA